MPSACHRQCLQEAARSSATTARAQTSPAPLQPPMPRVTAARGSKKARWAQHNPVRTEAAGMLHLPQHTPDMTIRVSKRKVQNACNVLELHLTLGRTSKQCLSHLRSSIHIESMHMRFV